MIRRISPLFANPTVLSFIRIAGAGFGFVTQCILAWILTPQQLGIFYSVTSLAAVAGIVAAQGYPQIAARFTARYRGIGGDRLFSRFVGHSMSESIVFGVIGAFMILLVSVAIPDLSTDTHHALWFASVLVVAITVLNVTTNFAAATKYFGLCYLPEGLFRPLGFLTIVGIMWAAGFELSAGNTTAIYTSITFAVALVSYVSIGRRLPRWHFRLPSARRLPWRWRSEAWKLILLSMFTNFFVDTAILLATPFLPSHELAAFGLIMKITMLAGYVVQVAQQMSVPDIAAELNRGKKDIQQYLRLAIFGPTIFILAGLVALSIMGQEILMVFGSSFVSAEIPLLILMISQFIRALAGPSSLVITLSGAQGLNATLCALTIVVLTVSNAVFIPFFGLMGAVCSVLGAYCFWLAACAIALERLGLPRTDLGSLLGQILSNSKASRAFATLRLR